MASNNQTAGIVFDNSYVLRLLITPYEVELKMDFVLTPEHPEYLPPGEDERDCFRRGVIRIGNFQKLQWDASGFAPSHDATGEEDWGCLDQFNNEGGRWHLAGDWGLIEIKGGELTLNLDSVKPSHFPPPPS